MTDDLTALLWAIDEPGADATTRAMLQDELIGRGLWTWEHVRDLVLAEPASDGRRLLAAAWFEADGQPERAEFIRVQVELAGAPIIRLDGVEIRYVPEPWQGLRWRECDLTSKYGSGWFLDRGFWLHKFDRMHDDTDYERPTAFVRRGFVGRLRCTAADWLAHADAITAEQPIEAVTLTTVPQAEWPEYEDTSTQASRGVRLRGRKKWRILPLGEVAAMSGSQRITRQLLALEWPRIQFTLPAQNFATATGDIIPGWAAAPADATPIADMAAFRDALLRIPTVPVGPARVHARPTGTPTRSE